jgi:hypothetical protein
MAIIQEVSLLKSINPFANYRAQYFKAELAGEGFCCLEFRVAKEAFQKIFGL